MDIVWERDEEIGGFEHSLYRAFAVYGDWQAEIGTVEVIGDPTYYSASEPMEGTARAFTGRDKHVWPIADNPTDELKFFVEREWERLDLLPAEARLTAFTAPH